VEAQVRLGDHLRRLRLPVWAWLDPAKQFVFGTDQLGRDMLTRMIYGARNTIGIAVATTCCRS
jgi:ABC-type dipeptide/oligopeptide/nickel transport system permease subunit